MRRRPLSQLTPHLLALSLLVVVIAACGTPTTPPRGGEPQCTDPASLVTIPDENLRASITTAVRRDTGGSEDLTCANLAMVKQLNIRGATLGSLEGIQHLVNVTRLSFDNSPFPASHATKLEALTKVKDLTFWEVPLDTLAFASKMKELETLSLDQTKVTSLEPLRGLPLLRSIAADHSLVTNLDAIGSLPSLTFFRSLGNPVTSLGQLVQSASLTNLEIENSQLASLSGITQVKTLRVLRVNGAKLTSVPDLSSMTSLEEVYFARNQLTAVPVLPAVNLGVLVLSYNQLTNLNGIARSPKIAKLLLDNNQLTDLLPLTDLADGITDLDLANNFIWELGPLTVNPNMFAPGAWLYLRLNCLGLNGALPYLYPSNNDAIYTLQARGVNFNYTPFQDEDLCDAVVAP